MSSQRLVLLLALVAAAVAPPASASVGTSSRTWATVNLCDTAKHPDAVGVRASMPGNGRRTGSLWMRFRLEFRDAEGIWHGFSERAGVDSGVRRVARRADLVARQGGWTFPFSPAEGDRYVLRGRVLLQWRARGGRVLRRAERLTTAGRDPATADPRGYSAATCTVSG